MIARYVSTKHRKGYEATTPLYGGLKGGKRGVEEGRKREVERRERERENGGKVGGGKRRRRKFWREIHSNI